MDANCFFPIRYDIPHNPKIDILKAEAPRQTDLNETAYGELAFGRYVHLLCILYNRNGRVDMTKRSVRSYVSRELGLDENELDEFLQACADVDLISGVFLGQGVITSNNVLEQIEYQKQKSEAGKKAAAARWGGSKKGANSTC